MDGCKPKKSERLVRMQAREDMEMYPKTWHSKCWCACCDAPCYGCYVMMCSCCASFSLRKRALHGDMTRYRCCNGAMSCCQCCCCEEKCPNCCLCLEAFLCFSMSVWTTRYMIQDEMRIQAGCCDSCIIGTLICMECTACIFGCIACITGNEEAGDISSCCHCMAEILWCTACTCMQTQHYIELNERDKGGSAPAPHVMQPPHQQQIATGSQPQPVYGGPSGYPPSAAAGYPPSGPTGYPQSSAPAGHPPSSAPAGRPPSSGPTAYPPYPPLPSHAGYPPPGQYYPPQQQGGHRY